VIQNGGNVQFDELGGYASPAMPVPGPQPLAGTYGAWAKPPSASAGLSSAPEGDLRTGENGPEYALPP
jgi:hypothetical protein